MAESIDPAALQGRRGRSQPIVILGLFVTFGGLVGYTLQVPSQPASLANVAPWLFAGFLTAWTGGILIGNARVAPPEGVSPALRGQSAVGALGTLAGSLSSFVVIERLGPWTHLSPGAPVELLIAIVAASMGWLGGFLMGLSMRRFIRRSRRRGSAGEPAPSSGAE
ncbi:MAG: hypothetical protein L3K14_05655 [Thermoplasmata archaeon]|nr:hypothetical protein [Thermoplasmata archaeon]